MDRITAMKVFVEVVTHKSQSAAADRLDMSRSTVTRYLWGLETWLGARLMHRTTRRFALTPAGEACLQHCQTVLEQLSTLEADTNKDNKEPSGLLRITATTWLWQTHLRNALSVFMQRYPKVKLDLLLGEQRVNLVEERIDLAIRITGELDPGLITKKLGICETVICASRAYLEKHTTPRQVSDLANHNCFTHSFSAKSEWTFTQKSNTQRVHVGGTLRTNEALVLMDAALEGLGVAKLPFYLVEPHLREGRLVQLLQEYKPHEMGIYGIYTSRQFMSTALRTLLDFLASYFEKHDQLNSNPISTDELRQLLMPKKPIKRKSKDSSLTI
ncbi:LysR family transcriptional regulator [Herbaspirillum huttiense]|uniref:LysR family transcriptional regulator n=2 Tax=Herbaspirillum huttiense TaxID=863372 RepID=A0AAJ2HC48_9BURK|nr:LysR family transcriptional regulator [Herbaspirillum huttiense]MDR9837801.1 LysR family transcriptional regulator [Herbaspirillum huttiense]